MQGHAGSRFEHITGARGVAQSDVPVDVMARSRHTAAPKILAGSGAGRSGLWLISFEWFALASRRSQNIVSTPV